MRLGRLGEFRAIERISRICEKAGREVAAGIGDDAAAYRPPKGALALAASDMLVEGVHFDLSYTRFEALGRKALAVNLSDIAAMGGRPRYYLVSLALPGSARVGDLDALYRGMETVAGRYGVRAIGGDTCGSSGPVVISVTILGEADPGRLVRRSGARPGDDIYVTGTIGDSAAGLELLKTGAGGRGAGRNLIARHLMPEPRVKAGMLLARERLASSMIDISDGLSSDLMHVLTQSGVGAVIHLERLPVSDELLKVVGEKKARELALHGGEDYELVFTARQAARKKIAAAQRKAGVSFTHIGSVMAETGAFLAAEGGVVQAVRPKGYEHFRR